MTMELSYDTAIPALDLHLKEMKSICQRDIRTLMFIAALFTITMIWSQLKCPLMNELIKKTWYVLSTQCVHIQPLNGKKSRHLQQHE
jgi:hypothetical protein